MASVSLKNYFVSMEDLDEDGNPVTINIDSDSVEITQSFTEAEEAAEDTEELEEAEEGLEAIYASLEASLEHGGLDPTAAAFAHHAVHSYVNRLGMSSNDIMPSLESFGGSSRRTSATTVSMETIGETLKKIWAAIKAAVEKAINAVTNFFRKLFDGMGRLEKKFNDLQIKANELGVGEKKKADDKIKVSSPNALMYKGSVEWAKIKEGFENLTTGATTIDAYITEVESIYDSLRKNLDDVASAPDKVNEKVTAVKALISSSGGKIKSKIHTKAMPGDKAITYNAGAETSDKGGENHTFNVRIEKVTGSRAFNGDTASIPLPELPDIKTFINNCILTITAVGKRKDKVDKVVKARKAVVDSKIGAIKTEEKNFASKAYDKTKVHVMMRFAQHDYIGPINQFDAYAFGALRAGYVLASALVNGYKKPA